MSKRHSTTTDRRRLSTQHPGVYYRFVADGTRRYQVLYTDANGKERTKTLPPGATLKDAVTFRSSLNVRRSQGDFLIPTKKTVGEILDSYLETRRPSLSEKTIETYEWAIEKHLKPAFGNRKLVELSPSDVARLISTLKAEGKKTWSVRKILTPLQGAFQIAVREGWVASSPVGKLLPHERPKGDQREMRCLSKEQIQSLLSSTTIDRWKTLFALLCSTGLRINEALNLTWDDIDLQEQFVSVRKSKTKAGIREVIMTDDLRSVLTAWKLKQAPGATYVFGTRENAPCGRREALRALRVAEDKAGIPHYTLHELRHTFASILIGQGELPTLVAKQMGHADPSITMKTYAHLWNAQESVSKARERLQEAMGGVL